MTDKMMKIKPVKPVASPKEVSDRGPIPVHRDSMESLGAAAVPMSILNNMPSPILLVDGKRQVVYVNPLAEELLHVTTGADLAITFRHPVVLAAVEEALLGKKPPAQEITLPVPVRRSFTMDVVSTDAPSGDPSPSSHWALIVLHDITQTLRTEQMRADFVANVSHELRSPLAALIGFIETIKGPAKSDADAQARFLNIMQREADRMSRLINDLLSLSKVEINEHIAPTKRVELSTLLQQVVELLTVKAAEKSMTLSLDPVVSNSEVQGDQDELNQVFQNLIDNAIKYGKSGTEVRIAIKSIARVPNINKPGIAISIRDHGPGIPADQLPRLTERFYRIDKARSRDMGGTGLGLAIVKHIVNRHRGTLSIESLEGKGSTFTVSLPQVR